MKGRVVLLGTSSAMPTKDRNNSAVYLQYKGEGFLFDCGEGTQRQIMKADLSISKVDYIFISHLHSDHLLGIFPLVETLDMHGKEKIDIFSSAGLKEMMNCFLENSVYTPEIKININQLDLSDKPQIILEKKDFYIQAVKLNHVIQCAGFSFVEKPVLKYDTEKTKKLNLTPKDFIQLESTGFLEKDSRIIKKEDISYIKKGFKFTYIPDTYKTENIIKIGRESDILVIECTYLDEEDKAREYGHLTLEYILEIMPDLSCKKVILTHFSRRYKNLDPFKRRIEESGFENIVLGEDLFSFLF